MGKPEVVMKQSEHRATTSRPTNFLKQLPIRKPVRTVPYKRMLMLQRRINSLINERNTWESKNKGLSDALSTEKLLSASLKKESFHWQRLYHESAITINAYKMKQFEMTQSLSTCLRQIDSIYPHMVAFTESITSTKINLTNLLNRLPSTDYSVLTKRVIEGGGINSKTEKPMKHKVGPMVKGSLIVTKPTIMIERLTLPQTRDQIINDDTVDDIPPDDNSPLAAIPEENEDPCFRHLPVRLKRSKLGTSWRQRRKENLNKDAAQERDRNTPAHVSCNEDSSDSEDIPVVMQHMVNIDRLVKGTSSSKVDSSCGGEEEGVSRQPALRHFPLRADDPMEGSSWMYGNYNPPHSKERRTSIYKSESSDDEEALIVQKEAPNLSSMNTLVMRNQSFDNSMTNKTQSKSESSSRNTSRSCTPEEPDSTNNVESLINKNLSTKGSKTSFSFSCTSSPGVSTDYGTSNNTIEQQLSKSHNRLSVCLSKVPSSTPRLSNDCSDRCSDLRNSPDQSYVTCRKRIRQPNPRYSKEDYLVPNMNKINNSKIAKLANKIKSRKSKNNEVRNSKKRLSARPSDMVASITNGNKKNSKGDVEGTSNETELSKSKTRLSKKSICKSKSSITNGPQHLQSKKENNIEDEPEEKSSKTKRSKSKPRLSKKSNSTTKPSISGPQHLRNSEGEDRPSRRNKSNVCYKESPLNSKKRRP